MWPEQLDTLGPDDESEVHQLDPPGVVAEHNDRERPIVFLVHGIRVSADERLALVYDWK
jgi:hypothetical protein